MKTRLFSRISAGNGSHLKAAARPAKFACCLKLTAVLILLGGVQASVPAVAAKMYAANAHPATGVRMYKAGSVFKLPARFALRYPVVRKGAALTGTKESASAPHRIQGKVTDEKGTPL